MTEPTKPTQSPETAAGLVARNASIQYSSGLAKVTGEVLTELRVNRKLTIQRVSHDTGVRFKLIDQNEKAEAHPANLIVLFALLAYYRVSIPDFFREVEARANLRSFTKDPKTKPLQPYVF